MPNTNGKRSRLRILPSLFCVYFCPGPGGGCNLHMCPNHIVHRLDGIGTNTLASVLLKATSLCKVCESAGAVFCPGDAVCMTSRDHQLKIAQLKMLFGELL